MKNLSIIKFLLGCIPLSVMLSVALYPLFQNIVTSIIIAILIILIVVVCCYISHRKEDKNIATKSDNLYNDIIKFNNNIIGLK